MLLTGFYKYKIRLLNWLKSRASGLAGGCQKDIPIVPIQFSRIGSWCFADQLDIYKRYAYYLYLIYGLLKHFLADIAYILHHH